MFSTDLVVQTGAGEASPGFDYSGTGTYTATFANGDSAASIDLIIIDDTLSEADEIVTISINTVSTGADVGTTTPIASFTILQELSGKESSSEYGQKGDTVVIYGNHYSQIKRGGGELTCSNGNIVF